jgi:putative transposase
VTRIINEPMSDRYPNFHQRQSIRLKGYDYSKAGLYFITICVQNRECLFGKICFVGAPLCGCPNDSTIKIEPTQKMRLNNAGEMIIKWYNELKNKYPEIRCHEMVVMPNHFHCIVEITDICENHPQGAHAGVPLRGRPNRQNHRHNDYPTNVTPYGPDNKKYDVTIGNVVDWFKTMTTNEYIRGVKTLGWKRFDGKLWQRNYWEHIIRNEDSYQRIAAYILENPSKWNDDQLNPDKTI